MKNGYILILVFMLCSCNSRYEKEDFVGSWESDDFHYVISLYDNDSCLVSNLPKCELYRGDPWSSQADKEDTTRICVHGTWEVLNIEKESLHNDFLIIDYWHRILVCPDIGNAGWGLSIDKGLFFWDKSTWKLYYSEMDKDENIKNYYFSRCNN